MSSLVVQKLGGSVLDSPQALREQARKISARVKDGTKMIVVVSALKGQTDQLIALAKEVSPQPQRRELDMLISTGERISASLLSMAIQDLGHAAISFTGSQAGVLTDGNHSDAQIIDIKPIRIQEALEKNWVVVLAGFQGVDPKSKEITTLGRGGTDTTAVAMAHFAKASRCEILKDVPGICSSDPKLVKGCQHLPHLTYNHLIEICFFGSKVLHLKAAEFAKTHQVELILGSSDDPKKRTQIDGEPMCQTKNSALSINSHAKVCSLSLVCPSSDAGFEMIFDSLKKEKLSAPQILASTYDKDQLRFMLTGEPNHLEIITNTLNIELPVEILNDQQSSVSITFVSSPSSGEIEQCNQALSAANVPYLKMISSSLSLTYYVATEDREKAIKALHGLISP